MRNQIMLLIIASTLLCIPTIALAHGDGDLGLTISGGSLLTGLIIEHGNEGSFIPGIRVFATELTNETIPIEWSTTEPGIMSVGGLPAGTGIRIDFLSPLLAWTGAGVAVADYTMTIGVAGLGSTTTGDAAVTGSFWFAVNSFGDLHSHPLQTLNSSMPADGVYILVARFVSNAPGVGASNPFAIVYGKNVDEEVHEAAVDWVAANIVPEPTSLLALAAGLLGLIGTKRWRKE